MEVKDKVRRRRMDRIKELRETGPHASFPFKEAYYGEEDKQPQPPLYHNPYRDNHPMNDPEYVWKMKWERDMAEAGKERWNPDERFRFEPPSKGQIRTKLILSVFAFAAVWGLFQINHPFAQKGRDYVRTALTESYDFKQLAAWYEKQFNGTPSLLPALRSIKSEEAEKVSNMTKHYFTPVQGKIITSFEPSRLGITVQTKEGSPVFALDTGRVIYSGNKEDTGYTVVIQHANGLQSTYGWLEQPRVEVNDWIKGGETVGTAGKNNSAALGGASGGQGAALYFALTREGKFINPTEVVSFD
ncbi:M23 family metallopeptidase [Paenibacillus hamazuiensis]|uniref:M23 family metallopeptidase n=1 Tax=Paenibacillus hamazuiensis TaxID=2936508 RepID=UPI00200F9B1D|nr:M23 family metallopeptidase [Paenibacillus hamazuiensis]